MKADNKIFINELKEGMTLESLFLCSTKALFTDKNGKSYLSVKLVDRSGGIEARIWDKAAQLTKNFDKLDYVFAQGTVVQFQGRLQFNLRDIMRVDPSEVRADYFLPHTKKDIETMYQDLLKLCRTSIRNAAIQQLMLNILEDPEMAPKFKRVPAATSNHHAWIGGLLEHVLQLCELARDVLPHYADVQADLVYAGLIMHDFGKIEELECERYFEYTDRGRLVGHLIISVEILLKKAAQIPDFPPKILQHLEHIILSHHGYLEHGSPKEPMTLEAVLVHQLDHLDSKLQGFMDVVAREQEGDPLWTTANNFMFKRPLYKSSLSDIDASLHSSAPEGVKNDSSNRQSKEPRQNPPHKNPRPGPLTTNLGDLLQQQLETKPTKE